MRSPYMRAGIRRLRRPSCQCAKSLSVYPFFILYAMDDDQSLQSPSVFVPESLTATELIEPFPQQRERHEVDDSFWVDLRKGSSCEAKLHIDQLLRMMRIGSK